MHLKLGFHSCRSIPGARSTTLLQQPQNHSRKYNPYANMHTCILMNFLDITVPKKSQIVKSRVQPVVQCPRLTYIYKYMIAINPYEKHSMPTTLTCHCYHELPSNLQSFPAVLSLVLGRPTYRPSKDGSIAWYNLQWCCRLSQCVTYSLPFLPCDQYFRGYPASTPEYSNNTTQP